MSYQTVTLACPELPLPCKDPKTGNLGSVTRFHIKSRLSPQKAIGELHRNYPPFSISHTFLKMLKYASNSADSNKLSPVLALIGEMGSGKTSSADLAFTLVDGVTPEYFPCQKRSLDELLFEPVFSDPSKGPLKDLEKRFNTGEMNPLNKSLLETEIPEAITTNENGNKVLNLERVGPNKVASAIDTIKTVIELEGIGAQNAIGITYREGRLIRAWKAAERAEKTGEKISGRLIIDEIDKRLPNTGSTLQQVWLVLQGQLDAHTVEKDGITFTFDKKKIPKGFSVVITGNDDRDITGSSLESAGLPQSLASRLTIYSVDKTVSEDLTGRICQWLCGMPLLITSLLPEKDSQNWRKLQELRTLGVDEPITEEESWLLKNYEKTLIAARQLAAFYLKWERLIDPNNPEIDDPILESTTSFREPPGVRMAHKHILRAKANDIIDVTNEIAAPSDDPLKKLLAETEAHEEELKGLGERIENIILESIQLSAGGPETKAKILQIAKSEGLIYEPDEENNPNKHKKLIRDLLSTDKETFVIEKETKVLQRKLYEEFIERYKDVFKDSKPSMETLIPERDLQASLNQLREHREISTTSSVTYMININPQYIEGNKTEKPIELFPVLFNANKAHRDKLDSMSREEKREVLMESEVLLTLIGTPKVGEETIEALWNEGWKKKLEKIMEESSMSGEDYVESMAGSSRKFRVAKVITKSPSGLPEGMMILDSPDLKKTWVIRDTKEPKTILRGDLDPIQKENAELGSEKNPESRKPRAKDTKQNKDQHTIKIIPKSEIGSLVEELEKELPQEIFDSLGIILFQYASKDNEEIKETLESSINSRTLGARIPMRVTPPTDNTPNSNGDKKTAKTSKKDQEPALK